MAEYEYDAPVSTLLSLRAPEDEPWRDFRELGLSEDDIPALIRLATDTRLWEADPGATDASWAPYHACRALGQLRATTAVGPLLDLLAERDDDDYLLYDLPIILAMIGPSAIPLLATYAKDDSVSLYARTTATGALARMAMAFPEHRQSCLEGAMDPLTSFAENDPTLNAFLILSLLDMVAVEALPLIEQAYAADAVDAFVLDWDSVNTKLGTDLPDPSPHREPVHTHVAVPRRESRDRAKKAKRNQAKKSRRRNR